MPTASAAARSGGQRRRRLALLYTLRPIAAVGCAVAAIAPFLVGPWRWGWSFGEAASVYLGVPWGVLGIAPALVAAAVAGRMVTRVGAPGGLWWLVVASFAAAVVGLAVAVTAV